MTKEAQDTNPQDPGQDPNKDDNQDFSERLQNQSAILGKVVNQSNNFAKELNELKGLVEKVVAKSEQTKSQNNDEDEDEVKDKDKTKKKVTAEESERNLSFKKMQERLEALEAKEQKKLAAARRTQLGRSLERYGVDPAASDKIAKVIEIDLGEQITVDDEGDDINVSVTYGGDTMSADDFCKMWLESDEGRPFKATKISPTPKTRATTAGNKQDVGALGMVDFSRKVAEAIAQGKKDRIAKLRLKQLDE